MYIYWHVGNMWAAHLRGPRQGKHSQKSKIRFQLDCCDERLVDFKLVFRECQYIMLHLQFILQIAYTCHTWDYIYISNFIRHILDIISTFHVTSTFRITYGIIIVLDIIVYIHFHINILIIYDWWHIFHIHIHIAYDMNSYCRCSSATTTSPMMPIYKGHDSYDVCLHKRHATTPSPITYNAILLFIFSFLFQTAWVQLPSHLQCH